jgi:hypothetical protein
MRSFFDTEHVKLERFICGDYATIMLTDSQLA